MRLELDASAVPAAIADFEKRLRSIPLRGGSRRARERDVLAMRNVESPQSARLGTSGARGRSRPARDRAERDLADAYATLSFLLMSAGRAAEALPAARRAVALEPRYWGNQFRLAHAAWGEERLQAGARA